MPPSSGCFCVLSAIQHLGRVLLPLARAATIAARAFLISETPLLLGATPPGSSHPRARLSRSNAFRGSLRLFLGGRGIGEEPLGDQWWS